MTIGLSSLYNEIKNGNTKVFSNNTVYNITFYHVIGRKISSNQLFKNESENDYRG